MSQSFDSRQGAVVALKQAGESFAEWLATHTLSPQAELDVIAIKAQLAQAAALVAVCDAIRELDR